MHKEACISLSSLHTKETMIHTGIYSDTHTRAHTGIYSAFGVSTARKVSKEVKEIALKRIPREILSNRCVLCVCVCVCVCMYVVCYVWVWVCYHTLDLSFSRPLSISCFLSFLF